MRSSVATIASCSLYAATMTVTGGQPPFCAGPYAVSRGGRVGVIISVKARKPTIRAGM